MSVNKSYIPRIAYVAPLYYPVTAGAEVSLSRLISGVQKSKKFRVRLYTNLVDSNRTILPGKERKNGFIYRIGAPKAIPIYHDKKIRDNQIVQNAKTQLQRDRKSIDLIYFNSDVYIRNLNDIEWFVSLQKPIIVKLIFDISTQWLQSNKEFLKELCKKNLLRFHCLTSATVANCKKLGFKQKDLYLIPNPLPTNLFKSSQINHHKRKQALGLDKYKFVFIFTGRLAPQKNIEGIINVFKRLSSVEPNICLMLCGVCRYPDYEPVIQRLKKETAKNNVIWVGEVLNKRIGIYLSVADFFILASKFEGLSNSLLEAMSTGLCPVAEKNISGVSDFIMDGKNGLLYTWNNLARLSRKFAELTPEKVQQLGLSAAKTVYRKSDVSVVIPKHLKMYQKLL